MVFKCVQHSLYKTVIDSHKIENVNFSVYNMSFKGELEIDVSTGNWVERFNHVSDTMYKKLRTVTIPSACIKWGTHFGTGQRKKKIRAEKWNFRGWWPAVFKRIWEGPRKLRSGYKFWVLVNVLIIQSKVGKSSRKNSVYSHSDKNLWLLSIKCSSASGML